MPSDDDNLAGLFFNFVAMQTGIQVWVDASRESRNAPWNEELDELADYCYLPAFALLGTYSQNIRTPGETPTYNKGWAYQDVSEMDRKDMSPEQRWKEDQEIVLRSLTAFAFIGQNSLPVPRQDEFMRGLRRMERSGEVPFWLTFALQGEHLSQFEMQMH